MPSLSIARRWITKNRWVQQSHVRTMLRVSYGRIANSLGVNLSRFGRKLLASGIVISRHPQRRSCNKWSCAQVEQAIHRDRDTDCRVFDGRAGRLEPRRPGVETQPPVGCLGDRSANCLRGIENAGFLASAAKSRATLVTVAKRRREQIVKVSRRYGQGRFHFFHKLFEQRLIVGASSQTVGRNPVLRLDDPPQLSTVGAKMLRLRRSLKLGRGSHRHSRPRRSDRGSCGSDRWVCRQDPSFLTSAKTSTPHRRFP